MVPASWDFVCTFYMTLSRWSCNVDHNFQIFAPRCCTWAAEHTSSTRSSQLSKFVPAPRVFYLWTTYYEKKIITESKQSWVYCGCISWSWNHKVNCFGTGVLGCTLRQWVSVHAHCSSGYLLIATVEVDKCWHPRLSECRLNPLSSWYMCAYRVLQWVYVDTHSSNG